MRSVWVVIIGCALVACGGSKDEDELDEYLLETFLADFEAKYCDEWARCDTKGDPCPPDGDPPGACDYDAAQARVCMDDLWECTADGFPFVPVSCASVCGQ